MLMFICFILLIALAAMAYIFWPSKKQEPETDPVEQKLLDYWTGKTDFVEIDGQVIGPPEEKPKKDIGMEARSRTITQTETEEKKPEKKNIPDFKFKPPKVLHDLRPTPKAPDKSIDSREH